MFLHGAETAIIILCLWYLLYIFVTKINIVDLHLLIILLYKN